MRLNTQGILTGLTVGLLLMLGALIRGLPLLVNGPNVLLDLDPYHSLRAVQSLMTKGVPLRFDTLSAAPTGSPYSFSTSQGYYSFIASLGILGGLSPVQTLAISPVIFYLLELVSILAIARALSKSQVTGLLAVFFAIGLQGWASISVLGGDPVAENLGTVVFLVSMLLLSTLQELGSYTITSLLAFLGGVTLAIHPVTFYFLNLVLGVALASFLVRREWKVSWRLALSLCGSTYGFVFLLLGGATLTEGQLFSQSAFWLASLKPFIFTIDNAVLTSAMGGVALVLAGISIVVVLVHRVQASYFLVAWAGVLYVVTLVGQLAVYSTYGGLVASIPFCAPLVLSHRVMPYLPPVLCILAAFCIGEFALPEVRVLGGIFRVDPRILTGALILFVVLSSVPQMVSAYGFSDSSARNPSGEPSYTHLFQWISSTTPNSSVFIANDLGVGEYIKALTHRAVFFTTSQEDLSVPDLSLRAELQTCVFIRSCSTNSTLQLLQIFRIDYAVIVNPAVVVDGNTSSFVNFNDDPVALTTYLSWFQSRPNFAQEFGNSNSAVFLVRQS